MSSKKMSSTPRRRRRPRTKVKSVTVVEKKYRPRQRGAQVMKLQAPLIREDGRPVGTYMIPPRLTTIVARQYYTKPFKRGDVSGTTVCGMAPYTFIYFNGTANSGPLITIQNSGGSPLKEVPLSPAFFPLNSPERQITSAYERYRFTKLKLIYTGNSPTSSAGAIWFGFFPDGAITSADILTAGNQSFFAALPNAANTPVWNPCSIDVSSQLPITDWYYVIAGTSVIPGPSYRQSFQGAVTAIWDISPSASGFYGYMWIQYEFELTGPGLNMILGNTLAGSEAHERFKPSSLSRSAVDPVSREEKKELKAFLPPPGVQVAEPVRPPVRDPLSFGEEDVAGDVSPPALEPIRLFRKKP